MKDDLLKIINHYGIDNQLKYIHSEYYELDEAIISLENDEEKFNAVFDKSHIAEEIADVMVMLKQLQYYYNIDDKSVEKVMKYKINRQLGRMESENNETSSN